MPECYSNLSINAFLAGSLNIELWSFCNNYYGNNTSSAGNGHPIVMWLCGRGPFTLRGDEFPTQENVDLLLFKILKDLHIMQNTGY